ncbi:dihydrolipoamide acetyltransferase family protein [Microbacterium murale]|uniref:Dihydrolipoamide acetyltransferase component of pyruvate dehydrogenase complex n=1 Tax=Microbacterium murale TaxID=1081040 RepID=A0ABU0P3X6_9MICO|nr:dihydrolipoamide acetyltransferase family protein [Microbacterium murale]MDQ0642038.1 pyruvate dehydrogenase E2 component (dihydrolipoamide acetyltransferase) [Microbacterium murale]
MIDIHMPRLSDTMEEGAIAVWHKKPGDAVAVGDLLVEIETDKATMEYEAYDAGVLLDIVVPEGEQATIGTVIARIDDGISETGDSATPTRADDEFAAPPRPPSERLFATPLVRRLAREHAIDLTLVTGSGPGGRIVRADIDDALNREDPTLDEADITVESSAVANRAVSTDDARQSTAVPFDRTRQVISRRLGESSSTTPHFFVTAVADVESLLALRADINAHAASSGRPKISINDLLVRACAVALREHPGVNASYTPEGRGATLLHERVSIGIAVSAGTGLVVPVVIDADQKSASQIASDSRRLTGLAKEGKLGNSDMAGGTFTISNLGMYGVEQFTAIISPPEGAILAVGTAKPEPVVIDGSVEVRHRMRYTLSADHRIIDGALAAQFLASLTDLLESPLSVIA